MNFTIYCKRTQPSSSKDLRCCRDHFKIAHEIISHSYWLKITDYRGLNYTEMAFPNVAVAF